MSSPEEEEKAKTVQKGIQEFSKGLEVSLPLNHFSLYTDAARIEKVTKFEASKAFQSFTDEICKFKNRKTKDELKERFQLEIENVIKDHERKHRDAKEKSEVFLKELVDDILKHFKAASNGQILLAPEMDLKRVEKILETGKELAIKYFDFHASFGYVDLYWDQKRHLEKKLDEMGAAFLRHQRWYLGMCEGEEELKKFKETLLGILTQIKRGPNKLKVSSRMLERDLKKFDQILMEKHEKIYTKLRIGAGDSVCPKEFIKWAEGLTKEYDFENVLETGSLILEEEAEGHRVKVEFTEENTCPNNVEMEDEFYPADIGHSANANINANNCDTDIIAAQSVITSLIRKTVTNEAALNVLNQLSANVLNLISVLGNTRTGESNENGDIQIQVKQDGSLKQEDVSKEVNEAGCLQDGGRKINLGVDASSVVNGLLSNGSAEDFHTDRRSGVTDVLMLRSSQQSDSDVILNENENKFVSNLGGVGEKRSHQKDLGKECENLDLNESPINSKRQRLNEAYATETNSDSKLRRNRSSMTIPELVESIVNEFEETVDDDFRDEEVLERGGRSCQDEALILQDEQPNARENEVSAEEKGHEPESEVRYGNHQGSSGRVNSTKFSKSSALGENADFRLLRAVSNGQKVECIKKILDAEANVNVKCRVTGKNAAHEVVAAIAKKGMQTDEALAILKLFVRYRFNLLNDGDSNDSTPLHYLMEIEDLNEEVLTWFLENGANPNATMKENKDSVLLHAIVWRQKARILRKLLKAGANPRQVNIWKQNALHRADIFGNQVAFEVIIDRVGVNQTDIRGATPLHLLFDHSELDHEKCLRLLREKGANFQVEHIAGDIPSAYWMKKHDTDIDKNTIFVTLMKNKDVLQITENITSSTLIAIVEEMESLQKYLPTSLQDAENEFTQFIAFLVKRRANLPFRDEASWNEREWKNLMKSIQTPNRAEKLEQVLVSLLSSKDYKSFVEVCNYLKSFC